MAIPVYNTQIVEDKSLNATGKATLVSSNITNGQGANRQKLLNIPVAADTVDVTSGLNVGKTGSVSSNISNGKIGDASVGNGVTTCVHKFINGTCVKCGAKDPSIDTGLAVVDTGSETHIHNFVNGKCACGATQEDTGDIFSDDGTVNTKYQSALLQYADMLEAQQKARDKQAEQNKLGTINAAWQEYLKTVNPQGAMAESMKESGYSKTGGQYNNQLGRAYNGYQSGASAAETEYQSALSDSQLQKDSALATETLSAAKQSDSEYLNALEIAATEGANLNGLLAWAGARGWSGEQISNLRTTFNSAQEGFTKKAEEEKAASDSEHFLQVAELANDPSFSMEYLTRLVTEYGLGSRISEVLDIRDAAVATQSTASKNSYMSQIKQLAKEESLGSVDISVIENDTTLTDADKQAVLSDFHTRYAKAAYGSGISYEDAKNFLANRASDFGENSDAYKIYLAEFNKVYATEIAEEAQAAKDKEDREKGFTVVSSGGAEYKYNPDTPLSPRIVSVASLPYNAINGQIVTKNNTKYIYTGGHWYKLY